MSDLKMSYENFFGAKTSVSLFISFENGRTQREGSHESARNWRANHVFIQLGLVHTSDGIGSGVGIWSARSVTIHCKSKIGIGSGVGSSTESESEGSEEFLFLSIPLLLPSLPPCRFTIDQNFLSILTPLTTPLPSLPSLVWTST